MDSQSPAPKKRTSKLSIVKTREILDQIKQDTLPLFRDLFDGGIKSIKDLHSVNCQQDPSFPTLIYLSRHLLSTVNVIIFGIEVPIIPIFINLTEQSFIKTEKERLVNPSRIAVYFIHDAPDGGVDFATCLIGAITISKHQETEPEKRELFIPQKRRIEF